MSGRSQVRQQLTQEINVLKADLALAQATITTLERMRDRLREVLQAAYDLGHNDDCAYCAHKDQLICRTLIQEADRG